MVGTTLVGRTLIVLALILLAAGLAGAAPERELLPPFHGLIRNNSSHELSIPSRNSLGTLLVPAKGWIEFTLWEPEAELICYREGQPYGCHKVAVTPKGFPYLCKNYDFLVEINPPAPEREREKYRPKYRKKVRKKKAA